MKIIKRTRAQESRAAIERLYIAMRHLFIRGGYKPFGQSGEAMIEAFMVLQPEIYGSMADTERVELDGLHYIFRRLPRGIEECRHIKLVSEEGYRDSHFLPIVPLKRRRNSYRIDKEQMYIEMTRGRSDIYDILTHLTFMYIESEKIKRNALDGKGNYRHEWVKLSSIVGPEAADENFDRDVACTYLSALLGRTYQETVQSSQLFEQTQELNNLFHIVYWLGRLALEEQNKGLDREITFSNALREKVGHHYYGEMWANNIKAFLREKSMLGRPIHIISANLHSIMNTIYAPKALEKEAKGKNIEQLATLLSRSTNTGLRKKVRAFALANGMYEVQDHSGMNIHVQVIDTKELNCRFLSSEIAFDEAFVQQNQPIILVLDYAFGEQAFEVMDELLKPFEAGKQRIPLVVESISIMGKAGILGGKKGDIMIPDAHVFEGSADNYPFENELCCADFEDTDLDVLDKRPMITVLGTSLQNKDVLRYFNRSSWRAIGLEMEGAHYQKAIQSAARIRKSISENVKLRYAYYASDNPLISGQTLASGGLGVEGVKPTYLITKKILNRIFSDHTPGSDKVLSEKGSSDEVSEKQ